MKLILEKKNNASLDVALPSPGKVQAVPWDNETRHL